MKGNPTQTFDPAFDGDKYAQRFRDQATGIGQTRAASERTGSARSQRVIDAAPRSQLAHRDPSYPAPSPVWDDAKGCMVDRATGLPMPLGTAGM